MLSNHSKFVHWFRSATPYINAFRGRVFVIAFGGEVVDNGKFVTLTHDLNLLASLGVKLVLVHGARTQIEARLNECKMQTQYVRGLRVTDEASLRCVKEACSRVRVEIEAQLSMGLADSPMAGADIRVAGGNFITAKPMGIIEGVDLLYTGEVRKIDAAAIKSHLEHGEIILLSPLGYSPTGEIFNLALEDVASATAIALRAEKLIFLMGENGVSDQGQLLRELTLSEANRLIEHSHTLSSDTQLYLPHALRACTQGVTRAHLLSHHIDGALLLELFTHSGIGTMLTQDTLENLRAARIDDVRNIISLIKPLESEGVLVRRNRELLEMEIDRFIVLEHDHVIIGCAALYPFSGSNQAELACLAVHTDYRGNGCGDRLLQYVEKKARERKINELFVLTTRAAHWFIEHGFSEAPVEALPQTKQALYNYQRRSKVFVKKI